MKNNKISKSLIKTWKEHPEKWGKPRTIKSLINQSEKIKKHFKEHPEHRTAISNAQKTKWQKYKRAINYCKNAGINLEND